MSPPLSPPMSPPQSPPVSSPRRDGERGERRGHADGERDGGGRERRHWQPGSRLNTLPTDDIGGIHNTLPPP